MLKRTQSEGFAPIVVVIALIVLSAVVGTGWYIWNAKDSKSTKSSSTSQSKSHDQNTTTSQDLYENWHTYSDTGSGISIKYPADWQVNSQSSNAFAWKVFDPESSSTSINVRYVFLNDSVTPEQEWTSCPSADACGATSGDIKLEGRSSVVNGLATYSTKMQSGSGIYYATVIKSNGSTDKGTSFVEFIFNNPDAAALDTYRKIVSSASF